MEIFKKIIYVLSIILLFIFYPENGIANTIFIVTILSSIFFNIQYSYIFYTIIILYIILPIILFFSIEATLPSVFIFGLLISGIIQIIRNVDIKE